MEAKSERKLNRIFLSFSRKKERARKRIILRFFLWSLFYTLALSVLVVVLFTIEDYYYFSQDKIYYRLKAEGINVGNMKQEEAVKKLKSVLSPQRARINFETADTVWEGEALFIPEIEKGCQKALQKGRQANFFKRELTRLGYLFFNYRTNTVLNYSVNFINGKNINQYTEAIGHKLYISSKDAYFYFENGHVAVEPSTDGAKLDEEKFRKIFNDLAHRLTRKDFQYGDVPIETISIPVKVVKPFLTTEKAQSLGIKEELVSYTDTYGYNSGRSHNIALFASQINNKIVLPGQVFSLNEASGPRDAEQGYVTAPIIVQGEKVPGIGGGNCQVGTAMFNAAFLGGYEIVERANHELFISHYPIGRDATVYYGQHDVKWRNDTPYGVMIRASASDTSLTIAFYSTRTDTQVEYSAYGGYPTATAYRTVKREGRIIHEDVFYSAYSGIYQD